ncbi:MAG: type II toxin-antitoxin system RelE/ParE family toxin [Candidatus Micrarchaeota archaeon]|nr:type II toxin-antitoxin system RelE/ParE family toxin [Candidatus Micrarchaeota archaeon]
MPEHYKRRIQELIIVLESEPVPAKLYDVEKLEGGIDEYRIRIGGIRVIYRVLWEIAQVEVLKIEWRGRAYK